VIVLGLMLAFALGTLLNVVHLISSYKPRGVLKFAVYALGLLGLVVLVLNGAALIQLLGLPRDGQEIVTASLNTRDVIVSVGELLVLLVVGNVAISWRLSRTPGGKRPGASSKQA